MDSHILNAANSRISKFPPSVLLWLKKNIPPRGYLKFAKANSYFKYPTTPFKHFRYICYRGNGSFGCCIHHAVNASSNVCINNYLRVEHPNMKELLDNVAIFKPKTLTFANHNVKAEMLRTLDTSSVQFLSFFNCVVVEENEDVLSIFDICRIFTKTKLCNIKYSGHGYNLRRRLGIKKFKHF